ncbi:MAG TPA: hypothetical protein VJL29_14185 [Thermoguttaceae bacterium]|nr:hypothetical protein [Thermoguttaceae bacterium]
MQRKTFYAWAIAAFGGWILGDHTWVTTYKPVERLPPDPHDGEYWYCWGDGHCTPPADPDSRFLARQEGDLEFAVRVACPNEDAEDCGLEYGKQGVCHQMANRILYATAIDDRPPLKVENARGYYLTVALYGEYGGKGSRGDQSRRRWEEVVKDWVSRRGEGKSP